MDNEEVIKVYIEFLYQKADRLATGVHICLGLSHQYFIASNFTGAGSGLTLLFIKPYALCPGKMVEAHEPYVMAVVDIPAPRIA